MKKIKLLFYILFILAILSGCKNIKIQSEKFEKMEKAPSSLQDISKGLQDILNYTETIEQILDGTYIMEEPKEDKEEDKKEEEKKEEEKKEEDNKEEDKKQTEEEKEQKKKQEKYKKTWETIDNKLEELHEKWNEYQGEGMKKGVTTEKIEKFTNSLNLLTKSIENKNVKDIFNFGSRSMLNIAPYFELYKDEIKGELNKIKYAAYQSYLNGIEGRNEEAIKFLNDGGEEISKIRLKLKKDDSKIKTLDKVSTSLDDMKIALKENSIKLTRIKKDIIIKNVEELGK